MAWTLSAGPREFFAAATAMLADAGRASLSTWLRRAASPYPLLLRAVAIVHAALLCWLLLAPGADPGPTRLGLADLAGTSPLPLLLATTGLLMCLLALNIRRDMAAVPPAHNAISSPAAAAAGAVPRTGIARPSEPIDGWSELMQRVSHELRTPLNAVIGFSDVMQRQLLGPLGHTRYVEYAQHIRQCGGDLLKATEDTLALTSLVSRALSPDRRAVPLATLVQAAHSAVAARLGEGAALAAIAIDRDCEVIGEMRALQQALANVLLAAIKRAHTPNAVEVAAQRFGDRVHLSVSVAQPHTKAGGAELELCVARTLLKLADLTLIEATTGAGGWTATIILDAAIQNDLFEA